jgi:hypothetical protein
MEFSKLATLCSRLLEFEITPFLLGVSSGQITPVTHSEQWAELKNKAQNNQLSTDELKTLVLLCDYERLKLVFELLDSIDE